MMDVEETKMVYWITEEWMMYTVEYNLGTAEIESAFVAHKKVVSRCWISPRN